MKLKFFFLLLFGLSAIQLNYACTRALFVGANNTVITGRSMDWEEDMHTNLWLFPRGIKRNGEAGPNSSAWTAKYGSIVASVYDLASADGMNEKGLVMSMLYLAEADYGELSKDMQSIAVSLWGQYVLDNFGTVKEAVESMQVKPFHLSSPKLPNGAPATVHLALSDPTGDSAIFEYIAGKLVIHHSKEYQIMTNSPIYSKQLALNEYWQEIGGETFLPGTSRASDRFARTSFFTKTAPKTLSKNYIQSIPGQSFENQAIAEVLSIMRAVSVPLGITTPDKPNIASTIWRSLCLQKDLIYYFDSATLPNTFWVSLNKMSFKEGSPILKLSLDAGQIYSGETSKQFKPAAPFKFLAGAI